MVELRGSTNNTGNMGYDIKFQDANNGYTVDQKGEVWTTTNGGTNWIAKLLAPR